MVKVNTLLSDMPAPNKIRYMEKHMRGRNATRDLLWLAISEYEYEYNLTISTMNIDWMLCTVKNALEANGYKINEADALKLKSYWNEAANGYIKLNLQDDIKAFQDCYMEMFQRFDKGPDCWNLNIEEVWKKKAFNIFIKDVSNQMKRSGCIGWNKDETMNRILQSVNHDRRDVEEYIGGFESVYSYVIRYNNEISVEQVIDFLNDVYKKEMARSSHYDWRAMLKER